MKIKTFIKSIALIRLFYSKKKLKQIEDSKREKICYAVKHRQKVYQMFNNKTYGD